MKRLILGAVALFAATAAVAEVPNPAFVPEAGFWWNENESGRGYAIEVQDRSLFLAAYVYENDAAGTPVWFTAGGPTNGQFDFAADLKIAEGGQCFGCVYTAPTSSNAGMDVRIEFTSAVTGNLIVDGEVIPITRFWYSPSISGLMEALLGQWQIVIDFTDLDDGQFPFEGDILIFDQLGFEDGEEVADGFQGTTGREASGSYNDEEDLYILVVGTAVLDRFRAYYFLVEDLGTDRFRGFTEEFNRGDDLFGDGVATNGFRTAGREFVRETSFPIGKRAATKLRSDVLVRKPGRFALKSQAQLKGLNATVQTLVDRIDERRASQK